MEIKTEVLDSLKAIGLNLYERKIYVALLAKGVATAAQVSEIATVPRSRSYDILESLADKGFVVIQPSKPIKYVALKPREALERTKEAMRKKFELMTERVEKLQSSPVLEELEKIHKEGLDMVHPTEMTGTLKGSHMISRQFQTLLRDAKDSVTIMTTEKGLGDLHTNHYRLIKKLARRGVKIRILAPQVKDKRVVKAFGEIADVKSVRSPVGRVAVVDGQHLLLSLTDDQVHESQDLALWARSEHAVQSLATPLFSQFWKAGE